MAESCAHSLLLSAPEFRAWRAAHPRRGNDADATPAVALHRVGAVLEVVLDPPHRHNAYSRQVRDALVEALQLPLLDPLAARRAARSRRFVLQRWGPG